MKPSSLDWINNKDAETLLGDIQARHQSKKPTLGEIYKNLGAGIAAGTLGQLADLAYMKLGNPGFMQGKSPSVTGEVPGANWLSTEDIATRAGFNPQLGMFQVGTFLSPGIGGKSNPDTVRGIVAPTRKVLEKGRHAEKYKRDPGIDLDKLEKDLTMAENLGSRGVPPERLEKITGQVMMPYQQSNSAIPKVVRAEPGQGTFVTEINPGEGRLNIDWLRNNPDQAVPVGDVLDWDVFNNLFPDIARGHKVKFSPNGDPGGSYTPGFLSSYGTIELGRPVPRPGESLDITQQRSFYHELQHALDRYTRGPRGSSPERFEPPIQEGLSGMSKLGREALVGTWGLPDQSGIWRPGAVNQFIREMDTGAIDNKQALDGMYQHYLNYINGNPNLNPLVQGYVANDLDDVYRAFSQMFRSGNTNPAPKTSAKGIIEGNVIPDLMWTYPRYRNSLGEIGAHAAGDRFMFSPAQQRANALFPYLDNSSPLGLRYAEIMGYDR